MVETAAPKHTVIIGGGIAGITAALDLADKGFPVCLVEKSPSIGGHMAQLDKTFPTLDCSICILAPKMVEVARHPNIKLFTHSEVKEVERSSDGASLTVKIVIYPRYVDESRCKGCRLCSEKCPTTVQNEFEADLHYRKAIYIPFPQAVPAIATIDENACLYLSKGGICRVCQRFCPTGAIDFDQREEEVSVQASSIIVATGYELLDPSLFAQYGAGRFPDVLSSLQYERMMNAAGPTEGKIARISDNSKPERILFIQCIGSRSEKPKREPYCSQVCCMYATKQAVVTKEHEPDIDVNILYNDLRVSGKGYQALLDRAEEEFKVKYLKGLPGEVQRDPLTGKLNVRYMDMSAGEIKEVKADLVVLCPAMIPRKGSEALAKKLGIEVDEFGFFRSSDPLFNIKTNVPEIFSCGCSQGPKDISHSVIQAHAAAAEALLRAAQFRVPDEENKENSRVSDNLLEAEPRVGVFVCHCGLNIANVVDVKKVVEDAKTLPNVAHAEHLMYTCSKDGTERIKQVIRAKDLNRVVVAACTPITHAPLFKSICKEAGLNPYLFEMVNIREHVSWVHHQFPEEATEKSKDLIRMAVAKASLLRPLEELSTSITPAALVVGGSVAGLVASKVIADAGFKVFLVEESEKLGGRFLKEYAQPAFSDIDVRQELDKLVGAVNQHQNIEVILSSKPTRFRGSIGKFEVSIESNSGDAKHLEVGVAVLTPDAIERVPQGLYGYGTLDSVHTVSEFRRMIEGGEIKERDSIGYIVSGGSEHCCSEVLDSALAVKTLKPASDVYVFYENIVLPLEGERFYRKGRELGITFVRFSEESKPRIYTQNGKKIVEVYDSTLHNRFGFPLDKIVLPAPLAAPAEADRLSSTFKVPLNDEGFFLEVHPKMRPIDFSTDGLFMAGTAHSPLSLKDAATHGLAAASRALTPLLLRKLTVEPLIAIVDNERCGGCGTCVSICEYNALKMVQSDHSRMVAKIDPMLCKGCGTCASRCPSRAIEVKGFTREETMAMIKAALETSSGDEPKGIAFLCNWCAYAGANTAGVSRFQYPPAIRIIRTMCSGMVDPIYVFYSLMRGADGVVVGGCKKGDCHYIFGNTNADETLGKLSEMLKTSVIDPQRFLTLWISAGEGRNFAEKIEEFTANLKALGPNPYRKR